MLRMLVGWRELLRQFHQYESADIIRDMIELIGFTTSDTKWGTQIKEIK
jgi:cysteinyl-tRNA synthetase